MNHLIKDQIVPRFLIYLAGLLIMSLGIVLLIKADFGAPPWDVFHVGLYYQFGLTIGTWSIIVGFIILAISAAIAGQFPQIGAFLNMVLVGLFIDMYFMLPFLQTPETWTGKFFMFLSGTVINAYGMGIYISARLGAGPRDSLMLAVTSRTGWKVQYVRVAMEILVLFFGWLLGGPVFIGTVLYSLFIGPLAGMTLRQMQAAADCILKKLSKKNMPLSRDAHFHNQREV